MYWQGVGGKLSSAVYLAPHPEFQREFPPSDKGNQTDVGCKHLSLSEIMFISLTTKYSKIMEQ